MCQNASYTIGGVGQVHTTVANEDLATFEQCSLSPWHKESSPFCSHHFYVWLSCPFPI